LDTVELACFSTLLASGELPDSGNGSYTANIARAATDAGVVILTVVPGGDKLIAGRRVGIPSDK
jgi:hypothetical protein